MNQIYTVFCVIFRGGCYVVSFSIDNIDDYCSRTPSNLFTPTRYTAVSNRYLCYLSLLLRRISHAEPELPTNVIAPQTRNFPIAIAMVALRIEFQFQMYLSWTW